jgi:HlyD family secretion protein
VNISANVSGRITHLSVREGDTVKAGQVVARIDSARFEADTQQARAGLEAQRADLQRALADVEVSRLAFDRTRSMHEQKLVSDQAFDQAQADFRMKTANVEALRKRIVQGEAALASVQDNLDKTVVASPMDGVVTQLSKEEGEVVIGAQSFQPTVIMTVADLAVMECEVMVDETDIANLRLGQVAEVRVDALENQVLKGEVTEIGSSAIPRGQATTGGFGGTNTGNQAKDFKVKITLLEPPAAIRPGLNAAADITTARKEKVLAVPIQAVVVREVKDGKVVDPGAPQPDAAPSADANAPRRRAEEKEGVFVVNDGKVHFRPVSTGIIGETDIEILDGLKQGDEIVSGSYRTLRTLKDEANVKVEEKKS